MTPAPTPWSRRGRGLRELGYLDAGVERILFRPVFEGRLRRLAARDRDRRLRGGPRLGRRDRRRGAGFSSVASLAVGRPAPRLADLLPAAILALLLSQLADRSRAPGLAATAAGVAAAAVIFALWIGGTYGLSREISTRALLWGIPVAAAALLLATAVRLAFLARAFARSGALPRKARRSVFAGAAAIGLLSAVLLFASRRPGAPVPAPQPSPRGAPTVVVAIDGLDLDGAGRPPAIAELLSRGATGWWPAQSLTPPELWTNLATGMPSRRHGVRALTRVKPAGTRQSLRPPPGTSWYFRRLGPLLRLVASAPVSGADRRSLDFWEVSAASGIPSLAVDWWASAPWPGATVVDNRTILSRARNGGDVDRAATRLFEEARDPGATASRPCICRVATSSGMSRRSVRPAAQLCATSWRTERGARPAAS